MNHQGKISLPVIKRLPRYYRYVSDLMRTGVTTVSSSELASILGTTASQVRQDLNCFGGFGQQGVGYNVEALTGELEKLLFSTCSLSTIVIGGGRLGRTISEFICKEVQGFSLDAIFDTSPQKIGTDIAGLIVLDVATLTGFCKQHHPQVAVLCIPPESTAALVPDLRELGVKGFWNFSHHDLSTDIPGIAVENVHLGDSLGSLGFRVRNSQCSK